MGYIMITIMYGFQLSSQDKLIGYGQRLSTALAIIGSYPPLHGVMLLCMSLLSL